MFARLLILFIAVPLVELYILLDIGRAIGTLPTVALIIATGMLGVYLARMEGFRTFFAIQTKMSAGEMPADELLDGLMILVAGALLITPGVLTDMFGFMLLYRPTREKVKRWLKERFRGRIATFSGSDRYTEN